MTCLCKTTPRFFEQAEVFGLILHLVHFEGHLWGCWLHAPLQRGADWKCAFLWQRSSAQICKLGVPEGEDLVKKLISENPRGWFCMLGSQRTKKGLLQTLFTVKFAAFFEVAFVRCTIMPSLPQRLARWTSLDVWGQSSRSFDGRRSERCLPWTRRQVSKSTEKFQGQKRSQKDSGHVRSVRRNHKTWKMDRLV